MKYLFLALSILSLPVLAEEPSEPKFIQTPVIIQQNIHKPFFDKSACQQTQNDDKAERRGCCSHHNGVCGCSGGRAQCCDGTLSPSCGC